MVVGDASVPILRLSTRALFPPHTEAVVSFLLSCPAAHTSNTLCGRCVCGISSLHCGISSLCCSRAPSLAQPSSRLAPILPHAGG